MTMVEQEHEINRRNKLFARIEMNRVNPEEAAKKWAIATVNSLFETVESTGITSRTHVALFAIGPSINDTAEQAQLHQCMHQHFLSELNLDSDKILKSEADEVVLTLRNSEDTEAAEFLLLAQLQRSENGSVHSVWYSAIPE